MKAVILLAVLAVASVANADLYMHWPRGSNNRLNEANRDRQNGARMFDSQNNNRGGVNVGTYGRPYYYVGSQLTIEWSIQHACSTNDHCSLIIQYYCDNNQTRDGLTTNTIPAPDPTDPNAAQSECTGADGTQGDCDTDQRYGRHESWDSYKQCMYRQRNMGLWTSAQDMRGRPGAIYTRQNNNGNRRGYECAEERDYYPYWHPTIWTDIAILTSETQKCAEYKKHSQNMEDKGYCYWTDQQIQTYLQSNPRRDATGRVTGFIPNNEIDCKADFGTWVVQPAWSKINPKIGAPDCQSHPITRDNHHGHPVGADDWPAYNWTIPNYWVNESCVLRLRYNMSSSETNDFLVWGDGLGDFDGPNSVTAGQLNATFNADYDVRIPDGLSTDENDEFSFRYSSTNPLWTRYSLQTNDVEAYLNPYVCEANTNCYSRGYVMADDPVVDIFGSLLSKPYARLELAVDTSQFSRTFQDRTHVFAIRQPPQVIADSGYKIYNLGVRGKRGNIVQVYPSIEYDFTPRELWVQQGEWIHFQWTGSNTNPNNNAGQGTQGTDRHNLILLRNLPPQYDNIAQLDGPPAGHTGALKQSYPAWVTDTSNSASLMGFPQDVKAQLAVPGLYTPHVDIGPLQVPGTGIFNYICTRNHAFTNRDQKARITVSDNTYPQGLSWVKTDGVVGSQLIAPNGQAWLRFTPDPVGLTTGSQIVITMDDGIVHVTPLMFDIVPGQQIVLEIAYNYAPLQQIYMEQSDYADFSISQEYTPAYGSGIASMPINRGGYYYVKVAVSVGGVVGIVIGCSIAVGGAAALWWKLRKSFSYGGKKAHLMDPTQA